MAEAKPKSAAPKAPAAKKPAAAKPAAAKKPAATAAKKPAAKKSAAKWVPGPEERYNMVQQAAYFIAERNGFNGNPVEFWTAAEAQISRMLASQ